MDLSTRLSDSGTGGVPECLPLPVGGHVPSAATLPLKTYIVEDSPVIRENLIATLEELVELEVVGTAEDEATAVRWLRQSGTECNLLIVDIFLKSGSGLGVLKAASESRHQIKRVVLSNYATPDMRRKCFDLGADRVFDKSNEIDALILYCTRLVAGDNGDGGSVGGLTS